MTCFELVLKNDRKQPRALTGTKVKVTQSIFPDVSVQGFLSVSFSLNPLFIGILENAYFPHLPHLFIPAFIPLFISIIVLFRFVRVLHSYCINDPIITKLNRKKA